MKTHLLLFFFFLSFGHICTLEKTGTLSGETKGRELFVSAINGDDNNEGTAEKPFKSIMAAVNVAYPGDIITVSQGTYRERISPVRGGLSDDRRIVFQAAPGERVEIKGSEVVKGWVRKQNDTWEVIIPNDFFGDFNPYSDLINGDWFIPKGRDHHTGSVYLNGHWLTEAINREEVLKPATQQPLWFARVDETNTTIWAQFGDADPNIAGVEINVRQTVFYPENPGINYITVRGFNLMHAATPWAPPTAEQIGLIGTHWSRGWIIENNDISYSTCVGITLGKYGDQWDNTSANSAEGYVETIMRALENGWTAENIGSHIVRNNRISHCEQAGIVGSLGAVFSTISCNVIHDIHVRQLFTGHEMAGIKIHGAIDFLISHNHIFRTCRGIWLDWMTQGARVTGNLLHDNGPQEDFFIEVNHGPFVVDNNISLSSYSLNDWSQGGTYAHNIFTGRINQMAVLDRETPFQEPHSTLIRGLSNIPGGDNHFYNNIFTGGRLDIYDKAAQPSSMAGNIFTGSAIASGHEKNPVVKPDFDPLIKLIEKEHSVYLQMSFDRSFKAGENVFVTSALLGRTAVSGLEYLNYDGSPLSIDTDYFGVKRNESDPFPGPFEKPEYGSNKFRLLEITPGKLIGPVCSPAQDHKKNQ
jgi:alpha-L-arabinofuranosidase